MPSKWIPLTKHSHATQTKIASTTIDDYDNDNKMFSYHFDCERFGLILLLFQFYQRSNNHQSHGTHILTNTQTFERKNEIEQIKIQYRRSQTKKNNGKHTNDDEN